MGGFDNDLNIWTGVLIPSATLSIVVNVFQTNLAWSLPWESLGPKEFNGKEYGEVIQVAGELHYAQGNGETELFLFFEASISTWFTNNFG